MGKLKEYIISLKISHKFTLLIFIIIVLPMVFLSFLFFHSFEEVKIKDKAKQVETNFTQNYGEIQKKTEMCFMSTQLVINNKQFWNGIDKMAKQQWNTRQIYEFYNGTINDMERSINSNPYLYQLRVYVNSDEILEMMPILYSQSRMMRLSWSQELRDSTVWYFDYDDTIFPHLDGTKHIVAYVTTIENVDNNIDATIEVATKMDVMFPDIYTSTEKEWTCFIDKDGAYYYNTNYESRWIKSIGEEYLRFKVMNESFTEHKVLDGIPVIVCYKPLKELGGHLIKIVSIEDEIKSLKEIYFIFLICFICVVLLLIFLSNIIVKHILKQFYTIMGTVHTVQTGNLEVRVPITGGDEIGDLGEQINAMLDRITCLMEESIKHELLVKETELRALQNQINAHFIYNVLESIKMMAEIEEKYKISDAVTSLGKLLRYSMKWTSKHVTVEEELEYIKNYLALINLRFDYEIFLSLNIPSGILSQSIPKMSLQPIVENAIYHGIEELAEDTNIYIKGNIYVGYCTIEITDQGRGMTEEAIHALRMKISGEIQTTGSSGNGIGLKNVQDRIKGSFGEEYGICIESRADCYTKVIVKIPLA